MKSFSSLITGLLTVSCFATAAGCNKDDSPTPPGVGQSVDSGCTISSSRLVQGGFVSSVSSPDTLVTNYLYDASGQASHTTLSSGATSSVTTYPDGQTVIVKSMFQGGPVINLIDVHVFNNLGEVEQHNQYISPDTSYRTIYRRAYNAAHELAYQTSEQRQKSDNYQSAVRDSTVYIWQNGNVVKTNYYIGSTLLSYTTYDYLPNSTGRQFISPLFGTLGSFINRPGANVVLTGNLIRKSTQYNNGTGQLIDSSVHVYQLDPKARVIGWTQQYFSSGNGWTPSASTTQIFRYGCK